MNKEVLSLVRQQPPGPFFRSCINFLNNAGVSFFKLNTRLKPVPVMICYLVSSQQAEFLRGNTKQSRIISQYWYFLTILWLKPYHSLLFNELVQFEPLSHPIHIKLSSPRDSFIRGHHSKGTNHTDKKTIHSFFFQDIVKDKTNKKYLKRVR